MSDIKEITMSDITDMILNVNDIKTSMRAIKKDIQLINDIIFRRSISTSIFNKCNNNDIYKEPKYYQYERYSFINKSIDVLQTVRNNLNDKYDSLIPLYDQKVDELISLIKKYFMQQFNISEDKADLLYEYIANCILYDACIENVNTKDLKEFVDNQKKIFN